VRGEYWADLPVTTALSAPCDLNGTLLAERLVVKNAAIMMYNPFLEEKQ
jgi:phage-related protein